MKIDLAFGQKVKIVCPLTKNIIKVDIDYRFGRKEKLSWLFLIGGESQ